MSHLSTIQSPSGSIVELFRGATPNAIYSAPLCSSCGVYKLYDYQEQAVIVRENTEPIKYLYCVLPTGSGKSLIMTALATIDYCSGKSVFILVPKTVIAHSFNYTDNQNLRFEGEEYFKHRGYSLPKGTIKRINSTEQSKTIEAIKKKLKHSRNRPTINICCYESFIEAYAEVRGSIDPATISVIIDELHHSKIEDDLFLGILDNLLGGLIKQLVDDETSVAGFTATGFRSDGADHAGPLKDYIHRRTLRRHYDEGYCPDIDIAFRFYDKTKSKQYSEYSSESDNVLIIDVPERLIDAYITEYKKNPDKPTLMIIPEHIQYRRGKKVTAAQLAVELENRLKEGGVENIINLGGLKNGKGFQLVSSDNVNYKERLNKLIASKKEPDLSKRPQIVISIRVMDEGADWPDCEAVFIPRVPRSMQRIVQLMGRALRRMGRDRIKEKANIVFFELGIEQDQISEVTTSLINTACRLQALFQGIEFQEPFTFHRPQQAIDQMVAKALTEDQKETLELNTEVIKLAAGMAGQPRVRELLQRIATKFKIDQLEALEKGITLGVIECPKELEEIINRCQDFGGFSTDPATIKILESMRVKTREYPNTPRDSVEQAIQDFQDRTRVRSSDFREFLEYLEELGVLEQLRINTPLFIGLLSGLETKELDRAIQNWQQGNASAETNKNKLLELAKNGAPRPNKSSKDPETRKLGRLLVSYTSKSSSSYDPVFTEQIKKLRPDWFENTAETNKNKLLELAKNGAPRPNKSSKDPETRKLGRLLVNYICKSSYSYDPVFTEQIKKLRPDWFKK